MQAVAECSGITKTSAILFAAGGKDISKMNEPQTGAETDEMRQALYREAVGASIWMTTMARLDLSHVAHQLAKFSENPGSVHWKAAKNALQRALSRDAVCMPYALSTSSTQNSKPSPQSNELHTALLSISGYSHGHGQEKGASVENAGVSAASARVSCLDLSPPNSLSPNN